MAPRPYFKVRKPLLYTLRSPNTLTPAPFLSPPPPSTPSHHHPCPKSHFKPPPPPHTVHAPPPPPSGPRPPLACAPTPAWSFTPRLPQLEWLSMAQLTAMGCARRAERWLDKQDQCDEATALCAELYDGHHFNPIFTEVDRVVAAEERPEQGGMFLVKWRGLPYSECTWETAEDMADPSKVAAFHNTNRVPPKGARTKPPRPDKATAINMANLSFKNGHTLRDYQVEGVRWLLFSWLQNRSVLLGDEMGLGKTVQIVAFIEYLRSQFHRRGPYLVVVPLSTVEHWQRCVDPMCP